MRILRGLLVAMCCLTLSIQTVQAQDKNAWREKLETTIPEGIRQLEAKEYLSFLKAFVEPDQFEKMSGKGSIEEFAKMFGEKKSTQLLAVLKSIKGKTPTLDNDGNKASFDVNLEGFSKKSISFKKIGNYWYIVN